MDLNYAKWNKVVEEDSSENSEADGKGGCGSRGRGDEGEVGIDCRDPMCSTCYPSHFSDCACSCPRRRAANIGLPPQFEGAIAPPFPFSETFVRSMMEGPESGQSLRRESAASATSIMGDGIFEWAGGGGVGAGESKARRRGQGPTTEDSNDCDPEASSVGSSNSGENRDAEKACGGNNSEGSGMSPKIDAGDPPILWSNSDTDSEPEPETIVPDIYEAFKRARARQTTVRSLFSCDFWVAKEEFTSAAFTDFYKYHVLQGRPVPCAYSCLFVNGFPRGFPEFVDLVGNETVDKREEISRADLPPGLYEYAREAVVQQAKSRRDEETRSKDGAIDVSREKVDNVREAPQRKGKNSKSKVADKASSERSKKNGSGRLADAGGAAVASALRREFEAVASQRRKAYSTADTLENQVRSAMGKLDLALQLEKAKHQKELAAERAAVVAAQAELKALVDGGAGVKLLSVEEALERAEALKKRANAVLADTRYPEAVEQYTLGIKVLKPHVKPTSNGQQVLGEEEECDDGADDDRKEKDSGQAKGPGGEDDESSVAAREMLLILLCNRSLAHLKWGNLASAKADAQQAMDVDPCHIKAYFRRAAAHKQAERYREALYDLRYILRLEPPPAKGAAVSDDMLAVHKMARECEQKLRAKGFKKALEETKSARPGTSTLSQKEARIKWDAAREKKGAKKKQKKAHPRPKTGEVWEQGTNFLPPRSVLPTLKELSARVAAESIDRAPEAYVHWCDGLLSEYLVCIFERLSWVSLRTMMSSGLYDEMCAIGSNAQAKNWLAQDRKYRRLYAAVDHDDFLRASAIVAAGRGAVGGGSAVRKGDGEPLPQLPSWKVLDPHLGLLDVLENHALFTHQEWDAEEEATPKLFDFNPVHPTGRAVVNRNEFFQQFNIFTEGQLTFMDWNNVVAAGGSVLAAMNPPPPGPLREFYHTQAYRSSDVDLFLYGLDEKAATEKVRKIYQAIKLANPKIFAVRTLRAITFVSAFPYRKIQIVLRLYKTLAEVLHGFDVDACSIGFDGHTVWCTNRAARAICKRYNVVDLSRRSPSYESRLFKYSKRGHAVFMRGMKVDKFAPSLENCDIRRHPDNEQGLAKLISLDRRFRRFNITFTSYYERWHAGLASFPSGELQEARNIHREENKSESDYTHVFIPYGRHWSRDRTWAHVNDYVRSANSWYYRLNMCDEPRREIQPVVFGTIDHVLDTGVNTGKHEKSLYSPDEDMMLMRMKHVKSDEMWIKDNPGSQGVVSSRSRAGRRGEYVPLLTGSFNPQPCSQEAWAKDAYVNNKRSSNRRS